MSYRAFLVSQDLLFCHGHDSWKVRFSFLSAAYKKNAWCKNTVNHIRHVRLLHYMACWKLSHITYLPANIDPKKHPREGNIQHLEIYGAYCSFMSFPNLSDEWPWMTNGSCRCKQQNQNLCWSEASANPFWHLEPGPLGPLVKRCSDRELVFNVACG